MTTNPQAIGTTQTHAFELLASLLGKSIDAGQSLSDI
jgi:hypothetical protein